MYETLPWLTGMQTWHVTGQTIQTNVPVGISFRTVAISISQGWDSKLNWLDTIKPITSLQFKLFGKITIGSKQSHKNNQKFDIKYK